MSSSCVCVCWIQLDPASDAEEYTSSPLATVESASESLIAETRCKKRGTCAGKKAYRRKAKAMQERKDAYHTGRDWQTTVTNTEPSVCHTPVLYQNG